MMFELMMKRKARDAIPKAGVLKIESPKIGVFASTETPIAEMEIQNEQFRKEIDDMNQVIHQHYDVKDQI